jgi:hypothetical protein
VDKEGEYKDNYEILKVDGQVLFSRDISSYVQWLDIDLEIEISLLLGLAHEAAHAGFALADLLGCLIGTGLIGQKVPRIRGESDGLDKLGKFGLGVSAEILAVDEIVRGIDIRAGAIKYMARQRIPRESLETLMRIREIIFEGPPGYSGQRAPLLKSIEVLRGLGIPVPTVETPGDGPEEQGIHQ